MSQERFFESVIESDVETVRYLTLHGFGPNLQDESLSSPLHYCTDLEVARVLIDAGAILDSCDLDLNTPLHKNIERENTKLAEFIIENQSSVTLRNKFGITALKLSYLKENHRLFQLCTKVLLQRLSRSVMRGNSHSLLYFHQVGQDSGFTFEFRQSKFASNRLEFVAHHPSFEHEKQVLSFANPNNPTIVFLQELL